MPLIKSKSNAARSENIREMIKAGHPPKQAEAAAYREQREAGGKKGKPKTEHDREPARDRKQHKSLYC